MALADLDSVRPWRRAGRRARDRGLVQAGNLPEGHVGWTDRLRALRAYAPADPEVLRPERIAGLRAALAAEAERTLARLLGRR